MASDAVEYPFIEVVHQANFERKMKIALGEYDGTLYGEILDKNVAKRGASRVAARKERKKIAKKKFRNLSIGALLSLIVISSFNNIFLPKIQKNQSLDYIKDNMVESELVQLSEESINIDMANFISSLEQKGLSRETSLYYIKEIYGDVYFDLAVKTLGYKDMGDYMVKQGHKDEVYSYDGTSVLATHPNIHEYKTSMNDNLIEEVNEIKRGM